MSKGDKCPGEQMSEGDKCPRGQMFKGDKCPGGQMSRGTNVQGGQMSGANCQRDTNVTPPIHPLLASLVMSFP